ncbi:32324_t:CDS:1, partial [Gigaspora margarita]
YIFLNNEHIQICKRTKTKFGNSDHLLVSAHYIETKKHMNYFIETQPMHFGQPVYIKENKKKSKELESNIRLELLQDSSIVNF